MGAAFFVKISFLEVGKEEPGVRAEPGVPRSCTVDGKQIFLGWKQRSMNRRRSQPVRKRRATESARWVQGDKVSLGYCGHLKKRGISQKAKWRVAYWSRQRSQICRNKARVGT
jgi:hypothetical protein